MTGVVEKVVQGPLVLEEVVPGPEQVHLLPEPRHAFVPGGCTPFGLPGRVPEPGYALAQFLYEAALGLPEEVRPIQVRYQLRGDEKRALEASRFVMVGFFLLDIGVLEVRNGLLVEAILALHEDAPDYGFPPLGKRLFERRQGLLGRPAGILYFGVGGEWGPILPILGVGEGKPYHPIEGASDVRECGL